MPVQKGKLKPDDAKRLTANYDFLTKQIDGEEFMPELFSKFVFTIDDKEEVSRQTSSSKRTQVMLDKLLNSGPGIAYNTFVEILERDYPHVAKTLRETRVDEVGPESMEPDYTWLDKIPDEIKKCIITDSDASHISQCLDENWRHVILGLGIKANIIDQERQNYPFGSITNVITALLIKWRQQFFKKATLEELIQVLQKVDATGLCTINWESFNDFLEDKIKKLKSS